MNALRQLRAVGDDIAAAFQFLTRIPVPSPRSDSNSLARATTFFPLVGLAIGAGAVLLQRLLLPHLPRPIVALLLLVFLVLITGCFHEDGLADTADGFGGGWNREQTLIILKDSRIGSYGAAALILSLLARYLLLLELPLERFTAYVLSAHVLCRWTSILLSYALPPAREQEGQGARIASLTSSRSLAAASIFTIIVVVFLLRLHTLAPFVISLLVTLVSGWFYNRKIGGVTGDCFGATNQLTEIAVYLCGVWST